MSRVLIVEDSPTQAMSLRDDLEAAHIEVTVAGSGVEALMVLETEEFDVILSDIVMPGMDGYELCRRVKDDPRTSSIPVILLTSLTDPLDVVAALEAGADNFIRKPYQAEKLIVRLTAAVQTRELRGTPQRRLGIQLSFMDRVFDITADRQQILDLLISTFEELVVTSRGMREHEEELARAHAALEEQLHTLDLAHNRLQAVIDSVPVPLFVIAPDGLVSHASEASAYAFGTTTTQIRGRRLDETVSFLDKDGTALAPEVLPHHRAAEAGRSVTAGATFDVFIDAGDTAPVPVVLHASPVLDTRGQPAGCVGTAHVLGTLAQHDPVTGLPNSAAYLDHATTTLAAPRGYSALMLLDLDRIDVTRVSHGGDVTNAALVEVSRCLRQVFDSPRGNTSSSHCFLAYLGGSQFGVVAANLPDSFSILHLAESARREVANLTVGADIRLTASVGVALHDHTQQSPALLGAASAALHRAQESGGDRVEVFGHAASQDAIDRLHLEIDLRTAIERDEISLHYQPQIDLRTGRIIGFEALARWQHPRLGSIDPTRFISVAEESGLILPLGRNLLAQAAGQARFWQEQFEGADLTIAVNVSAKQLRVELVEEVAQVLKPTGLHPPRLTLELTETAAMSHPETSLPILRKLAGLGVRLALDDFGTGYSSMAYLTRIHFDQLKLDKGFVNGIADAGTDAIVAQSIIALGRSLGIPILAEGIEQPEQAQILRTLGCDQGQGYLFGRPVPHETATALLTRAREQDFIFAPAPLPGPEPVAHR